MRGSEGRPPGQHRDCAALRARPALGRLSGQPRRDAGQARRDRGRAGEGHRRRRAEVHRPAPGPWQAARPRADRAAARPGHPVPGTVARWRRGGPNLPSAASVVTGIGVVEGTECLSRPTTRTVRGGTSNPWTVRKSFRAHDIALANRLPVIALVESGGADLPTQKEIFIPGGRTFRDLTRLSAAGIPTIAIVFGNSTAGGAYLPGMSDHVVMIRGRSKVFLGGPPLVKMATGEESDDESLGGAQMHARRPGLADYLADDEPDALRIGRRIVARLNWRKLGPAPAWRGRPSATVRRRGADRDRAAGPADAVRPARGHRPGGRRLGLRRVQAGLRPQPGHRLGGGSTAIRSASWPTRRASCSARSRRRPPSSSSWPTRSTRR